MGTTSHATFTPLTPASWADALFTPVQQRVLGWLFGQPERRFQSGELIRLASSGTGAVHRLLTRLAQTGLVTVARVGNQKHYQANPASPVFTELAGLIRKSVGLAFPLQDALSPLADQISLAFVYGSVARGEAHAASDIDLMVVADGLDYPTLYEALQTAEAALGRPIHPTLMSASEWQRKRGEADNFAARIAGQPRLMLIGSDDVD
jgi:predicted nucleotidyltransferase